MACGYRFWHTIPEVKNGQVRAGVAIGVKCSLPAVHTHSYTGGSKGTSFPRKIFAIFFPTCQVRVVRFYVCCPSSFSFLPSFFLADILAVLFARCRQMSTWTSRLQWAAPGLNRELQIAVGSAGPQPGSSGADWATPDLTRGAPERTGQRRTSTGDLPSGVGSAGPQLPEDMSEEMSKDMSEKSVRRYVRRNVRKACQKICQKKCPKI